MKNEEELEKVLAEVLAEDIYEAVNLAYLFGSRAEKLSEGSSLSDSVGPLSDYDFGIVISHQVKEDEGFPPAKRFKLQSRLSGLLDSEVDLVLLNEAPIELQYNVISSGVLLFERGVKYRVEYEAKVLGRYGDYLPVLRQQRKDIIDGGSNEARVQRYREALREAEGLFKQIGASSG